MHPWKTMTRRSRCNLSVAFKAKVAVTALKDSQSLAQLAERLDVHPHQITTRKNQLLERAGHVFARGSAPSLRWTFAFYNAPFAYGP